jgi:hypothetical protein
MSKYKIELERSINFSMFGPDYKDVYVVYKVKQMTEYVTADEHVGNFRTLEEAEAFIQRASGFPKIYEVQK